MDNEYLPKVDLETASETAVQEIKLCIDKHAEEIMRYIDKRWSEAEARLITAFSDCDRESTVRFVFLRREERPQR